MKYMGIKIAENSGRILNGITAIATLGAVIVSFMALSDTRSALESNQRAWLVPTGAEILGHNSSPIGLQINFKNTGHESALDVAHFSDSYVTENEIDLAGTRYVDLHNFKWPNLDVCRNLPDLKTNRPVYPGGEDSTRRYVLPNANDPAVEGILLGRLSVVVYGCSVYKTFNKVRHSPYCYYLQHDKSGDFSKSVFLPCLRGVGNAD